MGVWQSGRLGGAPLTYSDVTCGVTDFLKNNKKTPRALSAARLAGFSQSKRR